MMALCLACFASFDFKEVFGVSVNFFNVEKDDVTSVDTFTAVECFIVFVDVDDANADVDVDVIGIFKSSKLTTHLC